MDRPSSPSHSAMRATLDAIVADATYRVAMSRVGVREEDLRVADEAEFRVDRSVFPPAKVSAADARIRTAS